MAARRLWRGWIPVALAAACGAPVDTFEVSGGTAEQHAIAEEVWGDFEASLRIPFGPRPPIEFADGDVLVGVYGHWDPKDQVIRIRSELSDPGTVRHFLFHEACHAADDMLQLGSADVEAFGRAVGIDEAAANVRGVREEIFALLCSYEAEGLAQLLKFAQPCTSDAMREGITWMGDEVFRLPTLPEGHGGVTTGRFVPDESLGLQRITEILDVVAADGSATVKGVALDGSEMFATVDLTSGRFAEGAGTLASSAVEVGTWWEDSGFAVREFAVGAAAVHLWGSRLPDETRVALGAFGGDGRFFEGCLNTEVQTQAVVSTGAWIVGAEGNAVVWLRFDDVLAEQGGAGW